MTTRRTFLGAAAALLAVPRLAAAQLSPDGFITLTAQNASANLVEGQTTPVWSFGASWQSPVLRARQGAEFKVRFVNLLEKRITVHWFGVRGPAAMMSLAVEPGEANRLDCVFTPPDAGTFWFGPVADVSRAREMGLYGMLVVEEATAIAGLTDLPLIIDDWKLDSNGRIEASFGNLEEAIGGGRMGNWFTANGAHLPKLAGPARGLIRLRLLNAANVRSMGVTIKGSDPLVIARDGQPVRPANVGREPLLLAPGQRADLLLEESEDEVVLALDLFEDVVEIAYLERSGGSGPAAIADNFALPPNPLPVPGELAAARSASLVIEGGAKGGLKQARLNGETLELRRLLEKGFAWAVNGVAGLEAAPWASFALNETVILTIENRTAFDQPLALHGHVWQEIEREGEALEDEPWRDTGIVARKSTGRFLFVAANPGTWGIHSAIAERVDAGLITTFSVA